MKQINQTTEVAYSCIDFQDAITMLPVVDEIVKKYRAETVWLDNHRDDKWASDHLEQLSKVASQLRVLFKLGFCPSNPDMVQSSEWCKI